MEELLNASLSVRSNLTRTYCDLYDTVLADSLKWKGVHPSIIGMVCGCHPDDSSKRESIYMMLMGKGTKRHRREESPAHRDENIKRRRYDDRSHHDRPHSSTHQSSRFQAPPRPKILPSPILNGFLLLGCSHLRRVAQFNLGYRKEFTDGQNRIGYCVGGWKITDITSTIKNLQNYPNLIIMAGTNDITESIDEKKLEIRFHALVQAIQANTAVHTVILVVPPPLPYHHHNFNKSLIHLQRLILKYQGTKQNTNIYVVNSFTDFAEAENTYKLSLFERPNRQYPTPVHLNRLGTDILHQKLQEIIKDIQIEIHTRIMNITGDDNEQQQTE